jgi:hypothetical protein
LAGTRTRIVMLSRSCAGIVSFAGSKLTCLPRIFAPSAFRRSVALNSNSAVGTSPSF